MHFLIANMFFVYNNTIHAAASLIYSVVVCFCFPGFYVPPCGVSLTAAATTAYINKLDAHRSSYQKHITNVSTKTMVHCRKIFDYDKRFLFNGASTITRKSRAVIFRTDLCLFISNSQ